MTVLRYKLMLFVPEKKKKTHQGLKKYHYMQEAKMLAAINWNNISATRRPDEAHHRVTEDK